MNNFFLKFFKHATFSDDLNVLWGRNHPHGVQICTGLHDWSSFKAQAVQECLGSHTERSICPVSAQHKTTTIPANHQHHSHHTFTSLLHKSYKMRSTGRWWRILSDVGVCICIADILCTALDDKISNQATFILRPGLILCRPFKTHYVNIRVPWCLNY